MRKLILFVAVFALLAAPALAVEDTIVTVTIGNQIFFLVDTATIDDTYLEFGTEQTLGVVVYDLYCNAAWGVDAYYDDVDSDWDADWAFELNTIGLTLGSGNAIEIDSGTAQKVDDAEWDVDLTIEWADAPPPGISYDATIVMTAASP